MEKICGIYKITSPTGKIYIGQSIDCIKRQRYYKYLQCKGQVLLYHSIKKHGWSNHQFKVIEKCLPKELNSKEVYYINLHQSFNTAIGLNLQSGGGSYELSDESKRKIGQAHVGNKNFLGKTHGEYARKKLREYRLAHPMSKESIEKGRLRKIGNTHRGKIVFNTQTGIYYESLREAAKSIEMKFTTFHAQLSGDNSNRTNFIYA